VKTATVIPISIQRMVCSGCGAEANVSCNCGVAYMPKAVRAAEAIKANPEKSNRAIAAETGADEKEVRRQRAKLEETTADMSAVQKRTGLDGKTRSVRKRIPPVDPSSIDPATNGDAFVKPDKQLDRFQRIASGLQIYAACLDRMKLPDLQTLGAQTALTEIREAISDLNRFERRLRTVLHGS
jgi:hypothetical protein